jgi:tetratricopeptide (TPR) repeat protein
MGVWDRLETIIPMGENAAEVASLRRDVSERNGDPGAISSMELYRIYKQDAGKRTLLAPLLRHLAKRHLREAQLSADGYPDPLAVLAARLAGEGDLWLALEKFEVLMPRQRAWMGALPEPDVSQHVKLCVYMADGAAVRSQLGQFAGSLEWYMQAFDKFNQMAPEVRAGQSALEDNILSGVMKSLLGQFRYEDALSFLDHALKREMFLLWRQVCFCAPTPWTSSLVWTFFSKNSIRFRFCFSSTYRAGRSFAWKADAPFSNNSFCQR